MDFKAAYAASIAEGCFCRPVAWKGLGVFVAMPGQLGGFPFDKLVYDKKECWEIVDTPQLENEWEFIYSRKYTLPTQEYLQTLLLKRILKNQNKAKPKKVPNEPQNLTPK